MADSSEFVILLGDEPSEKVTEKTEEFVYLLDADTGRDDAAVASKVYVLPADSSIVTVMAIYQDLAELDSTHEAFTIDASKVANCDTASLQLLSSYMLHAKQKAKKINWHKPSDYFCELAVSLDFSKYLGLDEVAVLR